MESSNSTTNNDVNTVHLYDHPVSSYAQKIRIALREKRIPFTTSIPSAIRTGVPEASFISANPRLEVPTLLDGPVKILDSTIILEYIEDKWPSPRLLPADPASRARARMIEEICDTQYEAVNWGWGEILWFQRAEGELADRMKAEAVRQTMVIQDWLSEKLGEKDYFGGDEFGWADLCAAPMVNRSRSYGIAFGPETALGRWLDRVSQRESVKETFREFDKAKGNMGLMAEAFRKGERRREYRDHRLEWMVKSGGLEVVREGIENKNIRFSWP